MLKRTAVLISAAARWAGRESMRDASRKAAGFTGFGIVRASDSGCLGNAQKVARKWLG
jgi:hypothetical protein